MAVDISRPHHRDRASARKKIEELARSLSKQLGLSCEWQGDRLVFRRSGLNGHIDVDDTTVRVYVKKSPLLPVSEDRIRQQLETQMDAYLA